MIVIKDPDQVKLNQHFVLRSGKKKNSNNTKENAVKPHYMESSTESEEEDDRKLDASRVSMISQQLFTELNVNTTRIF